MAARVNSPVRHRKLSTLLPVLICVAGALVVASDEVASRSQGPVPGRGLTGTAQSPAAPSLEEAVVAVRDLPRLSSLLVSHHGELILERYFGGARAAQPANIKSAAKSVVSALVGIAIGQGLIRDVRQTIGQYFPEFLAGDPNRAKRDISVEDLLTMRSGLESTSNRNYGAWVRSSNWVRYALSRKLLSAPGTDMDYSTGNTHLLSAILAKVSRTSTWRFADQQLAKPLGFSLARWSTDPQGIYFGGNDMLMTPRQMVAFGELYLHRGLAGGRRVLSEDWVRASIVPRAESRWSRQQYGYGWWVRPLAGYESYHAWGFGGQFIFVVPALDLVVVSTSAATVGDDRRTHRRTVDDVIERTIVPAVASTRQLVTR